MRHEEIKYETVHESAWLYTLYIQPETPMLVIEHGSILAMAMAPTSFDEAYGDAPRAFFFKSDNCPSGKPKMLTTDENTLNKANKRFWLIERNDQLAIDTYYKYFDHCVARRLKIIEDELYMIDHYRNLQTSLRDGTMRIDISKGEEA